MLQRPNDDHSGAAAGAAISDLAQSTGLRLSPAPNPDVVPEFARQFSLRFDTCLVDAYPFIDVTLPEDLKNAVPKRQLHFRAGRLCAREALRHLDPGLSTSVVFHTNQGGPVWPAALVGSITHTDGFASAAVAWAQDACSIGIDSERVMSSTQARKVAAVIVWPSEIAAARAAGLDRLQAMTLAFSAKETFFKCVFPVIQRMFGYHDVRLVFVDLKSRCFELRIVKTLSTEFTAGATVRGRFQIDEPLIHTGMMIPAGSLTGQGS